MHFRGKMKGGFIRSLGPLNKNKNPQGVVALVTGGASGLGKATAERFLRQGGRVVIADLPSSKGAEVAASLEGEVDFAPLDVGNACLPKLIVAFMN